MIIPARIVAPPRVGPSDPERLGNANFRFTEFSEVASRGVYALCSGSEREERRESMQNFLDGLVQSTKTVMTRVELGGTLFLVAVIGVLLTSRDEGGKSD